MRTAFLALALCCTAAPANALYEGLQCVPFARALTGVNIFGDAHTWWEQAEGRYERGSKPSVGAVMTFIPHGNMRLGHVAAVRKVIDSRTLLISHANWSTIDGMRGHIEEDVRVIDVSEDNDWSRVRVWYTPNGALGTTEWPLHGFIYPDKVRKEKDGRAALASLSQTRIPTATIHIASALASRSATQPAAFNLSKGLLSEIDRRARSETAKRR